jgi:hypothetical protein
MVEILKQQIFPTRVQHWQPDREMHPKEFLEITSNLFSERVSKTNDIKRVEVLSGHFSAAILTAISQEGWFTMLRSPVYRVWSEYHFMKQKPMIHHQLIHKQRLDLQGYLYHPDTFYLENLQTRLLSGVSFTQSEQVSPEMLKMAKENLAKAEVVGITEQFEKSLVLFYYRLKWPVLPASLKTNQNASPKISEKERAWIRTREKYDIELYDDARALFKRQWEKLPIQYIRLLSKVQQPIFAHSTYLRMRRWYWKLFH